MNTRTSYADEDAQIPTGPSRVLVTFAVGADLVAFQFDQGFQRLGILCSPVRRRTRPVAVHLGFEV